MKRRRIIHTQAPAIPAPDQNEEVIQALPVTPNEQHIITNQVINIDQSALQGSVLPISLSVDAFGNITEGALTTPTIQGLDGNVQLQLSGNLTQGIQISGLDPTLLTQTLQIDANTLQQLQQQGNNISLTIQPNVLPQTIQGIDPNTIQNLAVSSQGCTNI